MENNKIRNTIAYYLFFVILGFSLGIAGPVLPSLAEQVGSTLGETGALFFFTAAGGIVGTALSGRVFDRVQRGHFFLGGVLLFAAILFTIIPFVRRLPVLLLIVFLGGVPNGVINNGANTLLMWTHGKKAGPYINGLHFAFGLGAFLAPTLYAQILNLGGTYQHAYWLLAVLSLPVALYVILLPNTPQPERRSVREEGSKAYLRQVFPLVVTAMLFLFFYVGAELAYANWLYTYTLLQGLGDKTQAAYLTSGFWLSFTVGRAISVPVAARFAPASILTIAFLGGLAILGAMLMLPVSLPLLWFASVGLGFFMAPIWATGYNLAGQAIGITATISSIILLGDSVGGMLLPWLVGRVIDGFGADTMPWLVFASFAANAFIFGMMLFQRKKYETMNYR